MLPEFYDVIDSLSVPEKRFPHVWLLPYLKVPQRIKIFHTNPTKKREPILSAQIRVTRGQDFGWKKSGSITSNWRFSQ